MNPKPPISFFPLRSRNCLVHSRFFVGVRVAYLICVVLLCILAFLIPCCDVHSDFRIKRCSVRPYLQLFVGGLMSHLCYLCLCLRILISKAYCVVFVFLRLVSCVTNVASFSGLFILDYPF